AEYCQTYGMTRLGSLKLIASPNMVDRPRLDPKGCASPFGNGLDNVCRGRKSAVLVWVLVVRVKPSSPPNSGVGRKYLPIPARNTRGFEPSGLYAKPNRGCQLVRSRSKAARGWPPTPANSNPPRRS